MNKGDLNSVVWLLALYTLQGVPLGMSAVFPLLLKERGASYADLAWFGMSAWPFALKLLWAPIVDGSSLPGLGRRKSWLIPCQLLIGALLFHLSFTYEQLLASNDVASLTAVFFALYFLAATQDIAVDGWALTMLTKDNVGYAGTCNSVGQTAGYFLAFSGFFGLAKLGICTLESFMQFWAILFVVVTVLVGLLKPEHAEEPDSIVSIYKDMFSVLTLKSVKDLCFVLLTCGVPFVSGLVGVKFQDAGVSSDVIALLATLTTPVHVCLPWLVARFLPKLAPLTSFRLAFPLRIMFQLVSVLLVILTPYAIATDSTTGLWIFYAVCLILSSVESAVMQVMFVSKMTFFARVSDPAIGGTFMTVLNTVSNIGSNIAAQLSYWLAQIATVPNVIDGFYIVVVFATVYGIVWLRIFGRSLSELEKRDESLWRVPRRTKNV